MSEPNLKNLEQFLEDLFTNLDVSEEQSQEEIPLLSRELVARLNQWRRDQESILSESELWRLLDKFLQELVNLLPTPPFRALTPPSVEAVPTMSSPSPEHVPKRVSRGGRKNRGK